MARSNVGPTSAILHNLRAVYGALEAALLRQSADPAVAPVVLPELFRCRALDLDIQVLGGAQAGPDPALRPATMQYVERLDELDATAPALLVAHAYVRYLGDLNGGQALRRIVARGLRLQGGAGTMFYDFGDDAGTAATDRADSAMAGRPSKRGRRM